MRPYPHTGCVRITFQPVTRRPSGDGRTCGSPSTFAGLRSSVHGAANSAGESHRRRRPAGRSLSNCAGETAAGFDGVSAADSFTAAPPLPYPAVIECRVGV